MRCVLLAGLLPALASAGTIDLHWQARLTGPGGLPLNGTHDIHLRLYDDATSVLLADELLLQTFSDEDISDGYVSLTLSGVDTAWLENDVWVGVTVDTNDELAPRQRLVSVPRSGLSDTTGAVLTDGAPIGGCTQAGAIRWDTSASALRVCDGTSWLYIGSGSPVASPYEARWTFDSGLSDSSTNHHDLTAQGNATTSAGGISGNALVLDGTSGTRASTTIPAVAGDPALTVAAWFKASANNGTGEGVVAIGNTGIRGHFYIRAWNAHASYPTCDGSFLIAVGADSGSSDVWHCNTTVLTTGTWYHVAATYDPVSHDVKIYLNGALERTVTLAQGLSLGSEVNVGGDLHNDNYFNGVIDNVVIYDAVLSPTDIAALYANEQP